MANQIQTIAVIGAGQRGRSITRLALLAGYRTILEDVSPQALRDAVAWLKSALGHGVACQGTERETGENSIASLTLAGSIEEALREADLVIEAAAEEMEAKIELFTIFDKFAKANAILASSSPALSIAEMASVTFCPEQCIGLRFPDAQESNSIELVITPETSEDTVEACREVARRMGKEVIVVPELGDSPGDAAAKSAAASR